LRTGANVNSKNFHGFSESENDVRFFQQTAGGALELVHELGHE
jgi:hypothetical protein